MKKNLVVLSILCYVLSAELYPIQNELEEKAMHLTINKETMKYLMDYGYLENMYNRTNNEVQSALKDFQHFLGVEPSGKMDTNTSEIMHLPRCGRPDMVKRRAKRYTFLGNRIWTKREIYYFVDTYTTDLNASEVNDELGRAFNVWSGLTNIKFKPTPNGKTGDINITFISQDGEGNVLGYADDPTDGNVVLDADEIWTKDKPFGVNLFQVAVHEFGHTLGLGHTHIRSAIMYPYYLGYKPIFFLHRDDIKGIKSLYKIKRRHKKFKSGDSTILCQNPKVDALFTSPDNYIYLLQKDKYWKFTLEFVLAEGPKYIKDRWIELPNDLDSAITTWNNVTYFFKDNLMWKYILDRKIGKSKLISVGFDGIPGYLDATFIWSGNGCLYLFKGDKYWMFDPSKPPGMRIKYTYPHPLSQWNGLPNNLDAAVAIEGYSYFFKDDKYYKYDDMNLKVEQNYPRTTAIDLFGCI